MIEIPVHQDQPIPTQLVSDRPPKIKTKYFPSRSTINKSCMTHRYNQVVQV
ncbi:hypothetical protein [Calothrix sp. PCC 7507]|uniref:hypothetical protein n=1 Tax=Calothrix sp. PCC 7507 TaxID=99598 RepID=UPI00031A336F|nr:hypothetical protein [Calothrix sp. PCC 7507]